MTGASKSIGELRLSEESGGRRVFDRNGELADRSLPYRREELRLLGRANGSDILRA